MTAQLQPTTEEKLELLRKAYRTLKQESDRREEAMAAERAAGQRERGEHAGQRIGGPCNSRSPDKSARQSARCAALSPTTPARPAQALC